MSEENEYGFDEEFEHLAFVGQELTVVSFFAYTLGLDFGDDVGVTVYGPLVYRPRGDGSQTMTDEYPFRHSNLMALIGQRVVEAKLHIPDELILGFENHGEIILSNINQYDSFLFNINGKETYI